MATSSTLNLSWNANSESDLNHYNVYRGTVSGFTVNPGVTVPVGTPSTNSFTDTGLSPTTTYYYRVSAVDNAGNIGPLSLQGSGTTLAVSTTAPAQVTGLIATPFNHTFLQVHTMWNANTEPDLAQYNIYRGTTPGFAVTPGVTVPFRTRVAPTTHDEGGDYATPGTYYFKVAAVDTGGDIGPLSAEASAVVAPAITVTPTLYVPLNNSDSDYGPNQYAAQGYHANGYTRPGKFGSHAVEFNTPNLGSPDADLIQYEKWSNPRLLQMDPVVGFSVALWIYPTTLAPLPYRRVLVEKADEPTQKWTIQLDSTGIAYFFVMKAGVIYKRQVSGFTTNAWQHVAAVFNGSTNTVQIYRNGVAGASSTVTPQWPGTIEGDPLNLVFTIGRRVDQSFPPDLSDGENYDTMFVGYMDEFLWYRSYLLSQAEVTSLVSSNITNTVGAAPGAPDIVPQLWLKLDGTYTDSSTFGNTVTPSNASGFTGSGKYGTNSVKLNTPTAALDNISVTTNTNIELDLANGFSYSFWIYPTSSAANQHILSKRIDANNYIIVWYDGSNGDICANVMKAGVMDRRLCGNISGGGLNAWHHIVITWTNTIMRGYIDAVPPPYPPINVLENTAPTTTNNLIIGNLSGNTTSGSKVFRGRIDEFQYFKGVCLGQAEVVNLMNTNSPD